MTASKGYDESQPRNGVIAFYTFFTVVTLVGVKLLLDSYFARTMDAEYFDKVYSRGMEQVVETRAREAAELQKAGLDQAMKTLAQRGRAASAVIAPESGQGKAEVQGWSKLGRVVPEAPAAPTPETPSAETPAAP